MPDLDLAQLCVACTCGVDPVELVDHSFIVKLLDYTDSFLADSTFGLCCACTTMMSAVNSWMRRDRVVPVMSLLHCRLSFKDICAHPEVRASLKLCQECVLVDNIASRSVDEHGIIFHLTEELLVDHTDCLWSLWRVDAHDV